MKKTIFILIVFLNLSIYSQETDDLKKSLLWEISGNGLKTTSYIFGTIHLIPEEDYFFTDNMTSVFEECSVLALEIDINIPILKQLDLAKKIILPEGKSLSDYMSPEDYSLFSGYVIDSLKIKKSKFNQITKLKPIFASTIILTELLGKTVTYETVLNKKAEKLGMEVIGFETAEYQMNILGGISIEKQIEMTVGDGMLENPIDEFNDLIKIYKDQDIYKMQEISKDDDLMIEYEDELLVKRNKNWIPIIENYIRKNSTFIAVGAMHLAGEYGIIKLLKEKGYIVKAIEI